MSETEKTDNVVSIEKRQPERPLTVWDDETVDLIKKQVCPSGISDGEFKLFIIKCKQTGMNPLIGEAFCVPRNTKVKTGNTESWVTQHVFQPAEQGMETRADRFDDFEGLRAAVVCEKDTIKINPAAGEVDHVFSPVGDRGQIVGAWAIAYRRGRKTPVEFVLFKEYAQSTAQWSGKPATMIVKCARAAALRRAYPQAFAGILVQEEIEVQAVDREEPPPAQLNPTSRTEQVLGKVMQQVGVPSSPPRPAQPSPSQQTVEAPAMPRIPTVTFGPHKGHPISGLSAEELADSIALATKNLTENPKAKWAAAVTANLAELKAEHEQRLAELSGEAPF